MEAVSVGASARLHYDANAAAAHEEQQVEFRAVVRGPVIGFVRSQRLEDFLDGVPLPRRAHFGVMFEVTLIGDATMKIPQSMVQFHGQ